MKLACRLFGHNFIDIALWVESGTLGVLHGLDVCSRCGCPNYYEIKYFGFD